EGERLRDARVDAGGRRLGVDAGRQALLGAGVDALDAEGALGGDGEPRVVVPLRLVRGRLAVGEAREVGLVARLIGAGDAAVGAANAQVVVDGDDAAGALLRRRRRAHVHAGRLVAVLAAGRHEGALHVGGFGELPFQP